MGENSDARLSKEFSQEQMVTLLSAVDCSSLLSDGQTHLPNMKQNRPC